MQSRRSPSVRRPHAPVTLYTEAERQRRDASPWTIVQGVLAPLQFAVFLVSLGLVLRYLATGEGLAPATCVGRHQDPRALRDHDHRLASGRSDVFGRYLFAPAFFWEDVVSMLVLALHTAYLAALVTGALPARGADVCSRWPPMPPTSSTPRSSCSSCGRRAATGSWSGPPTRRSALAGVTE